MLAFWRCACIITSHSPWPIAHNKYGLTLTVFVYPHLSSTLWAHDKLYGKLVFSTNMTDMHG
ncbi:MAG: hypothetical protein M3093_05045, partial [Thermoproteota archaeon]|nr:hypothetical protein [Thermoproteota archaeon]